MSGVFEWVVLDEWGVVMGVFLGYYLDVSHCLDVGVWVYFVTVVGNFWRLRVGYRVLCGIHSSAGS